MPSREVYQQIADGDNEGWEALNEEKLRFQGMALSRGASLEDAQDIQQEAFLELFKHKDTLDTTSNPDAYLSRIVRNKHIDLLRRNQARPQQVYLPSDSDVADYRQTNEFLVDHSPSVEDQVELKVDIEQALHDMNPDQAEVIIEAAKGFTHSEIAAKLDIPLGTMKTRMRLGRAKFR